MSYRVPSNLLNPLHMKRGEAHLPPCTLLLSSAAFVQGYQRSSFGLLVTGSISPFVKVVVHPTLGYYLLTHEPLVLMIGIQRLEAESRGEPNGIPCVVTVRVAVRVHIAEVVVVVVIRRTLPPVSRRTREWETPTDRFYRNTPIKVKTRLPPFVALENIG